MGKITKEAGFTGTVTLNSGLQIAGEAEVWHMPAIALGPDGEIKPPVIAYKSADIVQIRGKGTDGKSYEVTTGADEPTLTLKR